MKLSDQEDHKMHFLLNCQTKGILWKFSTHDRELRVMINYKVVPFSYVLYR